MTTDTERTLQERLRTLNARSIAKHLRNKRDEPELAAIVEGLCDSVDALEARVKEVEGERDAARARRLASSQRVLTIEAEAYERCAQIAENYGGAVASNIAARIRHALKETPDVD